MLIKKAKKKSFCNPEKEQTSSPPGSAFRWTEPVFNKKRSVGPNCLIKILTAAYLQPLNPCSGDKSSIKNQNLNQTRWLKTKVALTERRAKKKPEKRVKVNFELIRLPWWSLCSPGSLDWSCEHIPLSIITECQRCSCFLLWPFASAKSLPFNQTPSSSSMLNTCESPPLNRHVLQGQNVSY